MCRVCVFVNGAVTRYWQGVVGEHASGRIGLYPMWVAQRAQGYFQSLGAGQQRHVLGALRSGGVGQPAMLLQVPLATRLQRVRLEGDGRPNRYRYAAAMQAQSAQLGSRL